MTAVTKAGICKECTIGEMWMNDLISRQAAIDEIGEWIKAFLENGHKESAADARLIQDGIIQLPSAQPERLTDDDFETIRIHLNAYKEKLCNQHRWKEAEKYQHIIDRFMAFASAQPERKTWKWIETEGLDEEIRCIMCSNPMKTNRGCDGHCQYNEHLYHEIISVLENRITKVE